MEPEAERRQAASAKLQVAIEEYLSAYPEIDPGAQLGDWLLVTAAVRVNDDLEADADYYLAFRGGSMLAHVAVGLLDIARDLLLNGKPASE
jgi:hypothetical protein